jgi:hypothetical protein
MGAVVPTRARAGHPGDGACGGAGGAAIRLTRPQKPQKCPFMCGQKVAPRGRPPREVAGGLLPKATHRERRGTRIAGRGLRGRVSIVGPARHTMWGLRAGGIANLDPGGLSLRAAVSATSTRDREPSRLKSDQRNPAARDADEPAH